MDMDLAWCPVCEKQILPELVTITRPRAQSKPKQQPTPIPTTTTTEEVMQAPPPTPVVRKVAFAANPVTQTTKRATTTTTTTTTNHGLVHGTGRGPAVRATVAARKKFAQAQAQVAQAAALAQQALLAQQQAAAAAAALETVTEFSSAPPPLYCSEACREKDLDNNAFVFPSTSPPTAFRRLSSGSDLQSSSSESSIYEHGGGNTRSFIQRIPSSASVASSSAATTSSARSSSGGYINDPLNFTRTRQRARRSLQMTSSFTAVPCVKGLTVDERWKRKEEEQEKEAARWKIERLRRECDELNLGCDNVSEPTATVAVKPATTTRARKPSRPTLLLSSSPSTASTCTTPVEVLSRTSSCQSIAVNGVSPEDRSPIYGTVPRKSRRAASSTTSGSTRSRSPSSPLATDATSPFKRDPNHDAWSWEHAKDKSTLLYEIDPAMLVCYDNKRLWNFTREKMGQWTRPEGEAGLKTLVGAGEVREEKPVGWGKHGLERGWNSSAWLRSH